MALWHAVNRNDLSVERCDAWNGFHLAHTSLERHIRHRTRCPNSRLRAWIYTYPAALYESVRQPTGALVPGRARPFEHYGNPFFYTEPYRDNLLPWIRNMAGQPYVDFPSTGHRYWPDYNQIDIHEQIGRLQQLCRQQLKLSVLDDEEILRLQFHFGQPADTPDKRTVDYDLNQRIDDADLLYAQFHYGHTVQSDPPGAYQSIEGWFIDNAPEFFHIYHTYGRRDRVYAIQAYERFRTVLKAVLPHALIAANVYEGSFFTMHTTIGNDTTLTGWTAEWIQHCVDAVFFENWISHWASSGGMLPEPTRTAIHRRIEACIKAGKLVVVGVPHAVSQQDADLKLQIVQQAIRRWGSSIRFAEYRATLYTGREAGYPKPIRELIPE